MIPPSVYLQPVEYAIMLLLKLKSAVCSSSQTKRRGKYNPACTHMHTYANGGDGKLYCQDTQEPNCLFPLCCVSNLLIRMVKSS